MPIPMSRFEARRSPGAGLFEGKLNRRYPLIMIYEDRNAGFSAQVGQFTRIESSSGVCFPNHGTQITIQGIPLTSPGGHPNVFEIPDDIEAEASLPLDTLGLYYNQGPGAGDAFISFTYSTDRGLTWAVPVNLSWAANFQKAGLVDSSASGVIGVQQIGGEIYIYIRGNNANTRVTKQLTGSTGLARFTGFDPTTSHGIFCSSFCNPNWDVIVAGTNIGASGDVVQLADGTFAYFADHEQNSHLRLLQSDNGITGWSLTRDPLFSNTTGDTREASVTSFGADQFQLLVISRRSGLGDTKKSIGCAANFTGACAQCGEPFCGNGTVDAGEDCDDGDRVDGDGCSSTCETEAVCGNGILEPGEGCDDGNTAPGDGCGPDCQVEPNTCVGGADAWQPCETDDDCRDACVGGAQDGNPCSVDKPCPDGCVGGGRDGKPCKPGGSPKCKPGCDGGSRDGKVCKSNPQCPGVCINGTRDGEPCLMDMDCPGAGGTCDDSATCEDNGECTDLTLGCVDIGVCFLGSPSGAFLNATSSLVK